MANRLVQRRITLRFQLGQDQSADAATASNGALPTFDGTNDTVEIAGLRCSATIAQAGGRSMATLSLRVFGMPLDVMNKLTILGKPLVDGRSNTVEVIAGDDLNGMSSIYVGTIQEAWVDPNNAPQVAFVLTAFSGVIAALRPVAPTSYKGTVDLAFVVSEIARENGYGFENYGVSVIMPNPYYHGTALTQLQEAATDGNFNCVIESQKIIVWPAGTTRPGKVPLLSAETGLVGYPMRTQNGVELRTLFNPLIVFGGSVEVKSALVPANGSWTVHSVTHDLESETPGGKWFTTIGANIFGQETAIDG